MSPVLVLFIAFLILITTGLPLAFSMGSLAVLSILFYWDNVNVLTMLVNTCNSLTQNPTYLAAPLFMFMGTLLEKSGISDSMFDSMYIVMGRLRGGLAIATILICTLLAATTGVIAACITLMTMLALPAMMKYKYDFNLAAGSIMAAGSLGQLIPPSVVMIVYASQAQLSVGKMFAGGIGAGLMFSLMFIIYVIIRTIINPNIAPAISKEEIAKYSSGDKLGLLFKSILPTILLICAVLGSIMMGVATPTEGAAVGCFGALILIVINKRFSLKMLIETCYSTTLSTAMVFFIIVTASMFTYVFIGLRGGELITAFVTGLPFSRWVILSIILLILLFIGLFMDSYGLVMISVPVFCPIIDKLGFDPLWFSILFVVMMLISYQTPPFSYAAFYVKGAAKIQINLATLYRAAVPFVVIYMIGVVVLCFVPEIITYIPNKLF